MNHLIRAPKVRLIDSDGSQVGIVDTREALRMAQDKDMDVILISPGATPPVAKILDYGKYKYQMKKKAHEAKKKQSVTVVKEIKFRPNTDKHDIGYKLKHVLRFLEDGDKAKIIITFRGREAAFKSRGRDLMTKLLRVLHDAATIEAGPKMEGNSYTVLLSQNAIYFKDVKAKGEKPEIDLNLLEPENEESTRAPQN